MKKIGFLINVLLLACTCFVASCFSSGGEIEQPNIPIKNGQHGTKLDLDGTTYVQAVSHVLGLEGYAVVEKEAAQALANKGWDGILIILEECDDPDVVQIKEPSLLTSNSFKTPQKAQVVKALCYPNLVSFPQSPINLTVKTKEAEGTLLSCSFNGLDEDVVDVTTDAEGAHAALPHFSEWIFTLFFDIQYVETKKIVSEELRAKCDVVNKIELIPADYTASYGYRTDVKNPFVVSFLKQYFGKSETIKATHYYNCTKVRGVEVYDYVQEIYVCNLISGKQSFRFEVYGKPVSRHIRFISDNHNGGSGMNP